MSAPELHEARPTAQEPPLVRGAPVIGSALAYGRDAPRFLAACRQRHGDVFTITVIGQRMTFVLNPHDHLGVLKLQGDLSFSELAHEISARAFGHPRLEGELAGAIGRVTSVQLKGAPLLALTDANQRRLEGWLDQQPLGDGRPVGLYDLVRRALFVVGVETLFGEGGWDEAARADFEKLDARFPLLVAGMPAGLLGAAGARKRLGARLVPGRSDASELCRQRAAALDPTYPLRTQGQVELSLLWAALANTIPAAFWTLAYLVTDPAALARVSEEVRAAGGAATSAATPVLQSAVSEALRLTSASITLRRARRSTELPLEGGAVYRVREGDLVCLFPWLMHHDAEIFEAPEQFRYDRFLAGPDGAPTFSKAGRKLTVPLMPYGGGVSMCPGRHLANTEIKQFVAALLTRFDLAPAGGALPVPDRRRAGLGVLPPRGELLVRFTPTRR